MRQKHWVTVLGFALFAHSLLLFTRQSSLSANTPYPDEIELLSRSHVIQRSIEHSRVVVAVDQLELTFSLFVGHPVAAEPLSAISLASLHYL